MCWWKDGSAVYMYKHLRNACLSFEHVSCIPPRTPWNTEATSNHRETYVRYLTYDYRIIFLDHYIRTKKEYCVEMYSLYHFSSTFTLKTHLYFPFYILYRYTFTVYMYSSVYRYLKHVVCHLQCFAHRLWAFVFSLSLGGR